MWHKRSLAVVLAGVLLAAGSAVAQTSPPPAGDAAGRPAAQVAAPPVSQFTLLELLLKGGPVMFPLALCSIIMIAFTVERSFALRRSKVLPVETLNCLRRAVGPEAPPLDPAALLREIEPRTDPLARVTLAGLRKADRPLLEIEKAVEDAGGKEVARLQRNNRALSALASVSPLLGLLGTVTGIIRTFMTVAAHEESLGRTQALAGGIYEALVATAVGLGIAIASLVLYFFFQERVDRLATDIDDGVSEVIAKLPVRA